MAEQELSLLISLRDEATAQLRQMNSEIKNNAAEWRDSFGAIQGQLKSAGLMLAGFGAAITGAFGMAYAASETDRLANERLSITLRNVGVDYANVRDALDKTTESTARLTGIAKSSQLGALDQLVLTTGSYEKALKILPIALDLAAAKQMDAQTAALLLGRVAEGNVNALNRYGFAMLGIKDPGEALNIIQQKVAGSAVAMQSPLQVFKTKLDELSSTIGDLVAGPFEKLLKGLGDIVDNIKAWVDKHPELASVLADLGLSFGIGATVAGTLAIAIWGLNIAMAVLGGTTMLVLLAIAAIVALGVLLYINWDPISAWWKDLWDKMAKAPIIGPVVEAINSLILAKDSLQDHWNGLSSFWQNIWNEIKLVVKDAVNALLTAAEFLANMFLIPIQAMVNGVLTIIEGMVNGIITALNKIPLLNLNIAPISLPRVNIQAGSEGSWSIPRLTDQMMGIYTPVPDLHNPHGFGAPAPQFGPPPPPASNILGQFGNYGGLGQTIVTPTQNITINIEGSVLSDQDLGNLIRQELLKQQTRVPSLGFNP